MRAHSMRNSNQLFKVIELLQEIFYRIVLATLSWREKKIVTRMLKRDLFAVADLLVLYMFYGVLSE